MKLTQKRKGVNINRLCIGTGLVALDIILNGSPKTLPRLHTGGSCGNVLTILSYLGWETFPIARLADNRATAELEEDLKRWKVKTELITKTDDGSTPIIIHRILKDKQGKPKHRFEFRDPDTGKWLPQYKPVLSRDISSILEKKQQKPSFFYFDRINRASIELAKNFKNEGAIIFFEPSSIGSKRSLFEECLEVTDIVKFSSDRIPNYTELFPKRQATLEIETLGKDGLRFRFAKSKNKDGWQSLAPYATTNDVIDTAGAGDWCSAGVIYSMAGCSDLKKMTIKHIKGALSFGQALGAINCLFDGARGAMYELDVKAIKKIASTTINSKSVALNISTKSKSSDGKKIAISQLI